MKKSILIILGLIFFISCKDIKNPKSLQDELNSTQPNRINETELVIQQILDLPNLQWIYHPEVEERLPIKISYVL